MCRAMGAKGLAQPETHMVPLLYNHRVASAVRDGNVGRSPVITYTVTVSTLRQ